MVKSILVCILLVTSLDTCKAQDMSEINITLQQPIEEKSLFNQESFQQYFIVNADGQTLLLKRTKALFSGKIIVQYPTGEKFAEYNYIEGKQEGQQTSFYKNGNTKTSIFIENGKYQNDYIIYYDNGNIESVGSYDKGVHRSLITYTQDGRKNTEVNNDNQGARIKEIIYFDSGQIKTQKTFSDKYIYIISFYENGNKEYEGNNLKGTKMLNPVYKEGNWKYYYKNGNLKEEGNWGMGGRHDNSNIKIGVWKTYNEEGDLIKEQEYNNLGMIIKE